MKIREYVLYFYGSKFMKDLKTERDVRNPIVMTNILRKNPKYHKCYELYRFIERYEGLGVSYKVDEDVTNFTDQDMKELNSVMLSNYLALKSKNKKANLLKQTTKKYKPRVLVSLDDEEFVYGDLLRGPVEFMRIDQGYIDYLNSLVKKDLPVHPTKLEKEYYKEEYQEKTEIKNQKQAIEKIVAAKPDAAYLTLQGYEALKVLANGDATKIIVPNDLANVSTLFTAIKETLAANNEKTTSKNKKNSK